MKTWTVDDVMTTDVATTAPDVPYRSVVDELVGRRVSRRIGDRYLEGGVE